MPYNIPTRHGVVQPAFNLDGAKSAAGAFGSKCVDMRNP